MHLTAWICVCSKLEGKASMFSCVNTFPSKYM
nr:MAG TPA: hypothetical protein [Caudoviricetes sp.]